MLFRGMPFFFVDDPGVPLMGVPFRVEPGVLLAVDPGVVGGVARVDGVLAFAEPGVPFGVDAAGPFGVDAVDPFGVGVEPFGDRKPPGDCAPGAGPGPRCPGTSVPHRDAN
jgi:hypothetical protein